MLRGEAITQIAVSACIAGFEMDSEAKVGHGFVQFTLHGESDAEVVVGVRMIGHLFKNNSVMRNGFLDFTGFRERVSEIIVYLRVLRLDPQSLLIIGNRLLVPFESGEGETYIVERVLIVGIYLKSFFVILHRFPNFPFSR